MSWQDVDRFRQMERINAAYATGVLRCLDIVNQLDEDLATKNSEHEAILTAVFDTLRAQMNELKKLMYI